MIERFFRQSLPISCEPFKEWLDWADASGFLFRVFPDEQERELRAAAIVRPVTLEQATGKHDAFAYSDDGDALYIDLCAALDAKALRALSYGVLQRFGERKFIAFNSHQRGVRVHDFEKARKAIFKH